MDTNIKEKTLEAFDLIETNLKYDVLYKDDTIDAELDLALELVKDAINQLPDPGRTIIRLDVPTSWAESDEGREALDNFRHLQEELDDVYEE